MEARWVGDVFTSLFLKKYSFILWVIAVGFTAIRELLHHSLPCKMKYFSLTLYELIYIYTLMTVHLFQGKGVLIQAIFL